MKSKDRERYTMLLINQKKAEAAVSISDRATSGQGKLSELRG